MADYMADRERKDRAIKEMAQFLDALICAMHQKYDLKARETVTIVHNLTRTDRSMFPNGSPLKIEHECMCHQPETESAIHSFLFDIPGN